MFLGQFPHFNQICKLFHGKRSIVDTKVDEEQAGFLFFDAAAVYRRPQAVARRLPPSLQRLMVRREAIFSSAPEKQKGMQVFHFQTRTVMLNSSLSDVHLRSRHLCPVREGIQRLCNCPAGPRRPGPVELIKPAFQKAVEQLSIFSSLAAEGFLKAFMRSQDIKGPGIQRLKNPSHQPVKLCRLPFLSQALAIGRIRYNCSIFPGAFKLCHIPALKMNLVGHTGRFCMITSHGKYFFIDIITLDMAALAEG